MRWAHEHDEKKYVKPAPALLVTPFKRESSSVGTPIPTPLAAASPRNAEQYRYNYFIKFYVLILKYTSSVFCATFRHR